MRRNPTTGRNSSVKSKDWRLSRRRCVKRDSPGGREALTAVEQGEDALRALGFRQYRVRHHGQIVRIEIAPDELPRALTPEMAAAINARLKSAGFLYVSLDLEGYRQGSLNAAL